MLGLQFSALGQVSSKGGAFGRMLSCVHNPAGQIMCSISTSCAERQRVPGIVMVHAARRHMAAPVLWVWWAGRRPGHLEQCEYQPSVWCRPGKVMAHTGHAWPSVLCAWWAWLEGSRWLGGRWPGGHEVGAGEMRACVCGGRCLVAGRGREPRCAPARNVWVPEAGQARQSMKGDTKRGCPRQTRANTPEALDMCQHAYAYACVCAGQAQHPA